MRRTVLLVILVLLHLHSAAMETPGPGDIVPLGYWSEAVIQDVNPAQMLLEKDQKTPAAWRAYADQQNANQIHPLNIA